MPRIIVLSDGGSWEGFNAESVVLLDITEDAFERLCEGTEVSQLEDADITDTVNLEEWKRDAIDTALLQHLD